MVDVLLAAEDLTFAYRRGELILSNWSSQISMGEIVAVTGPSGSGKSTLLYLLGLMLKPTAGRVLVSGIPASQLSDAQRADLRANAFGFVFQDAALDSTRSVIDNIVETALYRGVSRSAALASAATLMDQFGVGLRAEYKPGEISGGQAQRIALCRALLPQPSIVLADEPTGNLDRDSSRVVITALREHAAKGNSVVVVTHDQNIAKFCDRQIEIDQ